MPKGATSPWNTSLTIDGTTINVFASQVALGTVADANGRPSMGTLICNMDFSADMHDKVNVPFAALKKFFDLANRVTQDKVKTIKIQFWSDDDHHTSDPLCVLTFTGWISGYSISSGGGKNHVLSISLQPTLDAMHYHDLAMTN